MNMLRIVLMGLLLASPAAWAAGGPAVATDNVTARLLAESDGVAPGGSVWVALEFQIRDGWHTYWRNPGDSGQATALAWTLPAGFAAGDIVWTTPHRFELPPLVNYGYAHHAMHLVKITAPPSLPAGSPVLLQAKASWLVCADVCIPESADLRLRLPVTAHPGADSGVATLFAAARAELPGAPPASVEAHIADGRLVLHLGAAWGAALAHIQSLAFFPYDDGVIEYAAPQTLSRGTDSIDLAVKVGYQPPSAGDVRGLLIATEDNAAGDSALPLEIAARFEGGTAAANPRYSPTSAPAGASLAASTRPAAPSDRGSAPTDGHSLGVLMALALLGGLILNLMPCVFPVLSIKAIGLVESAKQHPAAVRLKGLAFAAGVVGSLLCLAAVLLVLRSGGQQIGWGFQLQSPLFVTLMAYLLLAVGLNLSGVFEIGAGLAGVGDDLTRGDGYRASFFTGVLTTLVATPCTAPFMAAAVGAALTQSAAVALLIFASLGVGLALPFTLLSFVPALRRALPKPGAWMDTLKQLFAFPMYASAAWLLWVLAQQTSAMGLGAAFAGAVLIALAAWAYQKSQGSPGRGRTVALVTAAGALLVALWLPARVTTSSTPAAAAQQRSGDSWQPYDAARVAQLRAAGAPLLVNFTASWCLTCLVNERNAFADADVEALFRAKHVTLMKGDWTNRDPAITRALAEFGRAGVPLYLVYNAKPGSGEPLVLPQLLTATLLRDTFAALPDRSLPD
jgi:thiol:disulfide interchange protein DsbD